MHCKGSHRLFIILSNRHDDWIVLSKTCVGAAWYEKYNCHTNPVRSNHAHWTIERIIYGYPKRYCYANSETYLSRTDIFYIRSCPSWNVTKPEALGFRFCNISRLLLQFGGLCPNPFHAKRRLQAKYRSRGKHRSQISDSRQKSVVRKVRDSCNLRESPAAVQARARTGRRPATASAFGKLGQTSRAFSRRCLHRSCLV